MSLIGALNIGQSSLAAQQAALQVTGNNIANSGNADYSRQVAGMSPSGDQQIGSGVFVGTGVDLNGIQRQVDDALNSRLRSSISDQQSASTTADWSGRLEATFNELNGHGLSDQMTAFFNGWSNLAGKPQDVGLRQVVVQNGSTIAGQFNSLGDQISGLKSDDSDGIDTATKTANDLAQQIADLNKQIGIAEGGSSGQANDLRDQRDSVLKKLSQVANVTAVPQTGGGLNVYIGSDVLVDGAKNRGLVVAQQNINGTLTKTVRFAADNSTALVTSGPLGGLLNVQSQLQQAGTKVNALAGAFINEVNKVHASGQGTGGISSVTSVDAVADPTVPLNDPKTGLAFAPVNGSFVIHVKEKATGLDTSTLVPITLDGSPSQTTLNSLTASLNAIPNVSAAIVSGHLQINAGSTAVTVSFSQDTSGTLASLGINTFFTGSDARTMSMNSVVTADPTQLAAAKNGDVADNQTALAISGLDSQGVAALGGQSIRGNYRAMINSIGVTTASAKNNAEATQAVTDTLQSQRDATSGVSLDEESINLVRQQRAFQGTARFMSAVDQMLQTLLTIT